MLLQVSDPCVNRVTSHTNPQTIFDLLDMCKRYGAEELWQKIFDRLSLIFPSNYRDFVEMRNWNPVHTKFTPFDYTQLVYNTAVANMARENPDYLRFLPVALYRLCTFDAKSVYDNGLSPANMRALMIGRPKLSSAGRRLALIISGAYNECRRNNFDCQVAKTQLIIKLGGEDGWVDPFDMRLATVASGLCSSCILNAPPDSQSNYIWDNLPLFFELPPWGHIHCQC